MVNADEMRLLVSVNGGTVQVCVDAASSPRELKRLLPCSARDCYLTAGGKPLRERGANGGRCPTLGEQLARAGTQSIVVHPRQRGGCFIFSLTILTVIILAVIFSLCTCGTSLIVIPFLLPLLFVLPCCCL